MKPDEARLTMTEPWCTDEKWEAKNPPLSAQTDSFSGFCKSASGVFATDLSKTANIFSANEDLGGEKGFLITVDTKIQNGREVGEWSLDQMRFK